MVGGKLTYSRRSFQGFEYPKSVESPENLCKIETLDYVQNRLRLFSPVTIGFLQGALPASGSLLIDGLSAPTSISLCKICALLSGLD